jgi:hypothetical protein
MMPTLAAEEVAASAPVEADFMVGACALAGSAVVPCMPGVSAAAIAMPDVRAQRIR